jgi:hypothetical protein
MLSEVPTLPDNAVTEFDEYNDMLDNEVITGPMKLHDVTEVLMFAVPTTSRVDVGLLLPIPSRPVVSSLMYSVYVGS